jgi:hypothetical protein
MAKFSQAFLQGLLQPSFSQGMFDLGATIGGIPAARKAKAKEKEAAALQKGLFGLEQMAAAGELTPEMLEEARGSYAALIKENQEAAKEVRSTFKGIQQDMNTQAQKTAASKINKLAERLRTTLKDDSLTPQEKADRTATIQQDMNQAAKELSFSQQRAVGELSNTIARQVVTDERAEEADKRAKEKHQEWVDTANVREAQAEYSLIKFQEYEERGDIRQAEDEADRLDIVYKAATNAYRKSGDKSKEEFLERFPGQEDLWEQAKEEDVIRKAQLADAREKVRLGKFDYTEADLKDMGLTESQISAVQGLADNNRPKQANSQVMTYIVENAATPSLPSASLAKIFVTAAEQAIIDAGDYGYINEKEQKEIDRLAAARGLRAAQEAQRTGSLEAGLNIANGFRLLLAETAPEETDDEAKKDSTGKTDDDVTDAFIADTKKDLGL